MKKWLLVLVTVLLMGVLTGCGGTKKVKIELKNMTFSKTEIALKAGVPVQLVLVNRDSVLHDFSVDTIPITMGTEAVEDDHSHGGKEPDLHVSAKPGEQATLIFTPIEEGTYAFYCTVEGHQMRGTLYVTADGKMPQQR